MGNLLPIGTVVLLKNATKRVMIVGYLPKDNKTGKTCDYSGVIFPEGLIDSRRILIFDIDKIETVCQEGLKDDEEVKKFLEHVAQVKEGR